MAIPFYSNIDYKQNQALNIVIHNNDTAPTSPLEGQMYYNISDHILYYNNGTEWLPISSGMSGHTIQDKNGTDLTSRTILQFKGDQVTVTDDPTNDRTIVEVTAPVITVDDSLSKTSENPVQNKVITNALDMYITSSDNSVEDVVTLTENEYLAKLAAGTLDANTLYNVLDNGGISGSMSVPVGYIGIWPGDITKLPYNYKVCDGSSLNVADYPEYAALVGTTYGGDGVTTVNLPNMAMVYTAIDSAGAHNVIKVKSDGYTEDLNNLDKEVENLKTRKYKQLIDTQINPGLTIELPMYYKVGSNCLDVYLNGERLVLCESFEDPFGSYYEVGVPGQTSNIIQTTNDYSIIEGDYLQYDIRGEYTGTQGLVIQSISNKPSELSDKEDTSYMKLKCTVISPTNYTASDISFRIHYKQNSEGTLSSYDPANDYYSYEDGTSTLVASSNVTDDDGTVTGYSKTFTVYAIAPPPGRFGKVWVTGIDAIVGNMSSQYGFVIGYEILSAMV